MTQQNSATNRGSNRTERNNEKSASSKANAAPRASLSSDQEFQMMVNQIAGLRKELAGFRNQKFVRLHNSKFRMILFQLIRGMAFGLGSVLGATVILGIVVYLLSSIDFIPIIGDWAKEILTLVSGSQDEIIRHSTSQAESLHLAEKFKFFEAEQAENMSSSMTPGVQQAGTGSVTTE